MLLVVGPVEHAGYEIALGRYLPVADGAASGKLGFLIWMTMRAAEYMADPVFFPGEHGGFQLIVSGEGRSAEGTDSLFPGYALPVAVRSVFPGRGRENAVGKHEQGYADKDQKNRVERTGNHATIMHQNWPCRNR